MKIAFVSSLLLASSLAFTPAHQRFSSSSSVVSSSKPTFANNHGRVMVSREPLVVDSPTNYYSPSRSWVSPLAAAKKGQSAVLEKEEVQLIPTSTDTDDDSMAVVVTSATDEECVVPVEAEKELSETDKLLQQVKDAGVAGVISYALWELGFWLVSVPVVVFGYYAAVGHFPDLTDKEDLGKVGAEAFAFVNFARFAVPLRIGLALSTTPWIQTNIVDRFMKKADDDEVCEEPVMADQAIASPVEIELLEPEHQKQVPRWRAFLPFGKRKH